MVHSGGRWLPCHEDTQEALHACVVELSEASRHRPCEGAILETDSPALVKPSDDNSLGERFGYDLMRDHQPGPRR